MSKKIHKTYLTAYNDFYLGINKRYGIGYSELDNLRKFLNEETISQNFLYNNQSEYLVSVRAYPFWMATWFNGIQPSAGIKIGPFSASETHMTGCELQQQKGPINIGEYTLTRYYNNFMDYAPYTKVMVYIPFIGFKSLNTNQILGRKITFYATVDFDNGILTVWVETADEMIDSWNSQIGVDIAVNRTNATELARNLYLWGIKSITGTGSLMASPSVGGVSTGIPKSIKAGGDISAGFISATQNHVQAGEIGIGVNNLNNPTSIYMIIIRNVPNLTGVSELQDYAHFNGYPSNRTNTLSQLSGYTEIGEIHFNPSNNVIYDDEINEIIQLLRDGVIL